MFHILNHSQICEERISKPEEKLKIGQKVNAKIIDVNLEEKKIELVKTKTDPIGVERSTEYETLHLTVKPGDVIILYTDGVLEALNSEGKQYGLERLSDFISRNSGASAKDLSNKIKADIREFCGSERQHDDQTVLLMKINNTKKEL